MKYLKYLAALAAAGAVLLAAGCGASAGDNSSLAYEQTASVDLAEENISDIAEENAGKGENSSNEEKDFYVEDDSLQLRQTAEMGSLEAFEGKYAVKDADGVWYYFDGEDTCYYVQQGTYSFSHDLNADGVEADMIAMQFDTQSTPTYYTLESEDGQLSLRTTYSGDESETTVVLDFVKGMDKLTEMEAFEGIYSAYKMDNYRYEFHSDGTFYLVMEETYVSDEATLTLSAFGMDLTYDFSAVDGKIELTSEGAAIAALVPEK